MIRTPDSASPSAVSADPRSHADQTSRKRLSTTVVATVAAFGLLCAVVASAQDRASHIPSSLESTPIPDINALAARTESSMAPVVERYTNDRRALTRRYDAQGSPQRRDRLIAFDKGWKTALAEANFDDLEREAKADWILLNSLIDAEVPELERESKLFADMAELLPFADPVFDLHDQRRKREGLEPSTVAQQLAQLSKTLKETQKALERGVKKTKQAEQAAASKAQAETKSKADRKSAKQADTKQQAGTKQQADKDEGPALQPTRVNTHRAAGWTERIRTVAKSWYNYRAGYDPSFTWWVKQPYETFDKDLENYQKFLKQTVLGFKPEPKGPDANPSDHEDPPIIGDPIGRDALITYLDRSFIAYTPEELIAIAERDLAWGVSEMKRAAKEMGFGDGEDWQQALEKVKTLHAEPGDQARMVRDLAYEATEFLEESDMITIPPLAKEIWRIEMMSPERQKMSPFFLGGEVIMVSFPTDTMTNEQKQMSMRGNNIHFSRATVHHELIPGHHLQGFMTSRYNSHRRAFGTPFWGEGWALYWELRLWDMDFPRSPEDRIGMLFWRMHRDARVIWSLKFHLGEMTAQECVDFLVERIGHEKENALAEVRRSLEGRYSPIYQVAYLMGGFQFYALHQELVESGTMTERDYHDAVLQGGRMPVEMVRARLKGQELKRDFKAEWRFREQ